MSKPVFNFSSYAVEVEIAGKTFEMDCSSETGDYMKDAAKRMKEAASQVASGEKTKEEVIELINEVVDTLLGDGAYAAVLGQRRHQISDAADMLYFLIGVAARFQAERKARLETRAEAAQAER